MELTLALAIAVLFAAGTYMILRPNLIRMVMGFGLYSNGTNLAMIMCGGYSKAAEAPFVGPGHAETLMDPIPPDIILTAIVISFAVGALLLTLCYRVYLDHGTDNPELLPLNDDEPDTHDQHDTHDASNEAIVKHGPDFFHEIAEGRAFSHAEPAAHHPGH